MSGEGLREECGVFGIFGEPEAARMAYLGLHALQHRGQEGAGIVTSDGAQLHQRRAMGLVNEVFSVEALQKLVGSSAIGHVRYSTTGPSAALNVQPLVIQYRDGPLSIAHNGNLVNAAKLRIELEASGSIFATTSDTEVVLHLLAASRQRTFINRLVEALSRVQGAYSMLLLSPRQMVAVRDPHGFRPLVLGRRKNSTIVCSESCALQLTDAEYVREIEPGEMVIIDREGLTSLHPFPRTPRRACVFEHIYFSRPDSVVFGEPVYAWRRRLGAILAAEHPVAADIVVPVPDSGVPGALGYAEASGIPYQMGLLRSHYVGRTFIQPTQEIRNLGVKLKLSPVRELLDGKRVIVVDDSIVRGTTSRKIVQLLRASGAREVHLRITSPPMKASCYYGVDTPYADALVANRCSVGEIQARLGADTLGYLSLAGLRMAEGEAQGQYCEACFTGDYPIKPHGEQRAAGQMSLFGPRPAQDR